MINGKVYVKLSILSSLFWWVFENKASNETESGMSCYKFIFKGFEYKLAGYAKATSLSLMIEIFEASKFNSTFKASFFLQLLSFIEILLNRSSDAFLPEVLSSFFFVHK